MTNDNELFFPSDEPEFSKTGGFREIIDGIHHVALTAFSVDVIKSGQLQGSRQITWKWKVVEGPCNGANIWHSSPLEGYFVSKKDGQRVHASTITKHVVAALDPLKTDFKSFNPEDYIGREVEINVTTKKNQDGTTSLYAGKVHWTRPWASKGIAGPNISREPGEDDVPINFG